MSKRRKQRYSLQQIIAMGQSAPQMARFKRGTKRKKKDWSWAATKPKVENKK